MRGNAICGLEARKPLAGITMGKTLGTGEENSLNSGALALADDFHQLVRCARLAFRGLLAETSDNTASVSDRNVAMVLVRRVTSSIAHPAATSSALTAAT